MRTAWLTFPDWPMAEHYYDARSDPLYAADDWLREARRFTWDGPLVEGVVEAAAAVGYTVVHASHVPDPTAFEAVIRSNIRSGGTPADEPLVEVWIDWKGQLPQGNRRSIFGATSALPFIIEELLSQGPPVTPEAQLAVSIELLVSDLLRDLEDENSELRRALHEAQIESAFLRGQLLALNEAKAMGRKRVMRPVLGVIGAVLLAVTTGGAEAVASHALDVRAEKPATSVMVYVDRCESLQGLIDSAEGAGH